MTSESDRRLLLKIARDAIVGHVCGTALSEWECGDIESMRAGAFVTLHIGTELRGCIGHIEGDDLLPRIVARCAVAACSADPRFAAVGVSELDTVTIELSILGPLEPIGGVDDVELGRHGLVVERGHSRGLLLPQVAIEWKWNREQFLEHTCRKAGLPRDAWANGAMLWRFEAEVFRELAADL
jgi:AmmeMemoRadiSam system protein A